MRHVPLQKKSLRIKFAILEDDKIVLESMKEFLSADERLEFVGQFQKAEDFIIAFPGLDVQVVLTDIGLPGKSGIELVSELKQLNPNVQFLMCTSFEDPTRIFTSLQVGATGYILKTSSPNKLIAAIIDIAQGGSPMSPEIARLVVQSFVQKRGESELLQTFSKREQEILHALAKGYQYREIAEQLFIGVETVRTYLRRIYEKLHVRSKVEALNKVFPK